MKNVIMFAALAMALVGCAGDDGRNGLDGASVVGATGAAGLAGDPAVVAVYYSLAGAVSCKPILSTGYSFRKVNSTSNEVHVWNNATCADQSGSGYASDGSLENLALTEQNNDSYIVPGGKALLTVGGNNSVGMRAVVQAL